MKMDRRTTRRAFLKWLERNQSRFRTELKLGRRTEKTLEFSFVGINRVVTAALTDEINVDVNYQNYCWDLILSLDRAEPVRVPGGYICAQCLPEYRRVFQNRFSLYADHLFERLLDWVNDDLAKAKWLKLAGKPGKSTWVELKAELPEAGENLDKEIIFLPLRSEAS